MHVTIHPSQWFHHWTLRHYTEQEEERQVLHTAILVTAALWIGIVVMTGVLVLMLIDT